ncbi:MAG: DNA polymerase domain-containing protein [Candidatus Woesearchaeota archaeon]
MGRVGRVMDMKNIIDYVVYGDTDSCVYDTEIVVNNEKVKIGEFYNRVDSDNLIYQDDFNNNFVKLVDGFDALSYNKNGFIAENKRIKYVMKHKVKKRLFKIKWNGNEVVVTEDHSIIVERNNEIIDISPLNIKPYDKIFGILIDIITTDNFEVEDLGVKEEWVYDIETEDNHNFFANNILLHNSVYVDIDSFIKRNVKNPENWEKLPDEEKINYIKRISSILEDYINEKTFSEVQKKVYNSIEENFKITWKQEKIAKTAIFIKKKKYATHTILDEGKYKDDISITGLEIIRSDTPLIFKEGLNKIIDMILRNYSDEEICKISKEYIDKAKTLDPSQISSNTGIHGMWKYIREDGSYIKGTPWHVKGAANYNKLLKMLKIKNKYPPIQQGVKAKVIYVKNNPYGVDAIAYQKWPKEFDEIGITPDYDKMIDKFFINKVDYLLSPEGKEGLINKRNENVSLFF